MLVLTRRAGESFLIGDDIEISIIEVGADKVKIGISAPKSVRVLRRELLDEARGVNAEAADVRVSLQTLADMLKEK